MPALAVNSRTPANLLGATQSLTMGSPSDFELNSGAWAWQHTRDDSPAGLKGVNETLATLWKGRTGLEASGRGADESLRVIAGQPYGGLPASRSEEHTSEIQSLMRIPYAVFCLNKKTKDRKT